MTRALTGTCVHVQTPSVLERCLNGYYRLQFRIALVRAFANVNQARADHGLAPIHDKQEVVSHQLVLSNSAFGLEASRPMAPHFAMVGLLRSRSLTEMAASSKAGSSSDLMRLMPSALVAWLEQGGHLAGSHSADSDLVYISFPPDVPLAPEFVTQLVRLHSDLTDTGNHLLTDSTMHGIPSWTLSSMSTYACCGKSHYRSEQHLIFVLALATRSSFWVREILNQESQTLRC